MTARRQVATIGAAVVALLIPCAAHAQTDLQLWGNFTFDWIKDHRITMGVDAEPKVLRRRSRPAIPSGPRSTSRRLLNTAAANGST